MDRAGEPPELNPVDSDSLGKTRAMMVDQQLVRRGIRDPAVLRAMGAVARHLFVNPEDRERAYGDHPILLAYGQTISQPYMVARMVELCQVGPTSRVLEVGAGCGYQSAVLAEICGHVFALEIVPELACRAAAALGETGVGNATVAEGDGSEGWPVHAPFDAIVVAAGAPAVPPPLLEQLGDRGRLVIPVDVDGGRSCQVLQIYERHGDAIQQTEDTTCRFVDLQGRYGW